MPYYDKFHNTAELPELNRRDWQQAAEGLIIPEEEDPSKIIMPEAANLAEKHLPDNMKRMLERMQQPHGPAFLTFRNMPIDRSLPLAPTDGKRPKKKLSWVSEMTLLGVARASDLQPLSYREEKGEALVHEIAPHRGLEQSLSNGGRIPLGFHTDESILKREYRPEYLMLMGLINRNQIPTYVATLDEVLKKLEPRKDGILREPRFRVESPESFHLWGGKVIQSEPRPLITKGPNGEDEIAGNLYAVKTKDEEARRALDALVDILPRVAKPIVLQPADLLVFNNNRCLHARAAIAGERWLQRLLCRRSLEQLRHATGSWNSIFDTRFLVLE